MINEACTQKRESARPEGMITAAFSIERDFRGLVDKLGRALEMIEPSDEEMRQRIVNTKAAAERGLRLSKLLLRATRRRRS